MVSPVLNEQWYTAEFLVRDLGTMSREIITLDNTAGASDLLIQGGTVFSFAALAAAVVTSSPTNTGNGAVTNAAANPLPEQLGNYVVTMTDATHFGVVGPDGDALANGVAGTPYSDGIAFQLNVGGTAFVAGDHFTVTIANGVPPAVAYVGTGNGTLTNVEPFQSAAVLQGNYIIDFTGATTFNVEAPDGRQLAAGRTGVVYEDEVTFLITAGGTAYVAGDRITIGFGAGTGRAVPYTGALPAAGIVYNRVYVPAGGTSNATAIMRMAEVNASKLQFGAGVTLAGMQTAARQLKQLGISAR